VIIATAGMCGWLVVMGFRRSSVRGVVGAGGIGRAAWPLSIRVWW